MSFPPILARLRWPTEGCWGTASSGTNLWAPFSNQRPWDSIVILEESNKPHPWCPQCDIFVPEEKLNKAHPASAMCQRGVERKRQRLVVEETEERMGMVLLVYRTPLTAVTSFKYLEKMLSSSNNDWPVVEQNLRREWRKWGWLVNILGR